MKLGHNFIVIDNIARCSKCNYEVNLEHAKIIGVYLEDLLALKCAYDLMNL